MKQFFKKVIQRIPVARRLLSPAPPPRIPHGPEGIEKVGHRRYIGGLWDELGKLQLDFLIEHGLQPHHYCLDVACGSLRAGVHLIPYLEAGRYLGIDKERSLIEAGIEDEIGRRLYEKKNPQFVVSSDFEFEKFDAEPDYALAQSLFTHLPAPFIETCFRKLRPVMKDDGMFFATFFETEEHVTNPDVPHDHTGFGYTHQQMERFGTDHGWSAHYIGDWNHPKNQVMVQYRPA